MSMVLDHYRERWHPLTQRPWIVPGVPVPQITPEEVAEFRKLLERAREYDRQHNQENCELEEKKALLKEMADRLGVNIDFVDEGVGVGR